MKYTKTKMVLWGVLAALALTLMASAGESLITLSWLKSNLLDKTEETLDTALEGMEEDVLDALDEQLEEGQVITTLTDAEIEALARQAAAAMSGDSVRTVQLKKGQLVTGPLGGGFVLESGTASVNSFTGNDLINVTLGTAAAPGIDVAAGSYYLIGADNGCGLTVTSDTAAVRLLDGAFSKAGYTAKYAKYADALSKMGIFRGSDKGYELERVPTRQEALILLIRLLGEEPDALAWEAPSPFTDLTGWLEGRRYIAYGAQKGYTNGVTATTFNQYGSASRHVYLTYVLRALGYSDAAGDFVWNTTSDDLAVTLGLMTRSQLQAMDESGFYRDHVVLISRNALTVRLKDGTMTLGERLAMDGHISWEDYYAIQ